MIHSDGGTEAVNWLTREDNVITEMHEKGICINLDRINPQIKSKDKPLGFVNIILLLCYFNKVPK